MEWTAEAQENNGVLRVKLSLTHEELAQLIGYSRESVSRSLGEFRRQRLARSGSKKDARPGLPERAPQISLGRRLHHLQHDDGEGKQCQGLNKDQTKDHGGADGAGGSGIAGHAFTS